MSGSAFCCPGIAQQITKPDKLFYAMSGGNQISAFSMSRQAKTKFFPVTTAKIRQVADDLNVYFNLGWILANYIARQVQKISLLRLICDSRLFAMPLLLSNPGCTSQNANAKDALRVSGSPLLNRRLFV
jgi:hypothetical protein